ncbi:MAG: GIY-YIG nuclease family protein [Candidatus Aenigmarchaeota archaeon]|nr:GIY-YIG nuclease family protein [Candidatus Aenigmarchaeota archaeon]
MFYVYVLKCRDGSLYTGYTNNVEKRLITHRSGKASRYTRNRLPVELVAHWKFKTKSEAMRHEIMFKSLSRKTKMKRILKSGLS